MNRMPYDEITRNIVLTQLQLSLKVDHFEYDYGKGLIDARLRCHWDRDDMKERGEKEEIFVRLTCNVCLTIFTFAFVWNLDLYAEVADPISPRK